MTRLEEIEELLEIIHDTQYVDPDPIKNVEQFERDCQLRDALTAEKHQLLAPVYAERQKKIDEMAFGRFRSRYKGD